MGVRYPQPAHLFAWLADGFAELAAVCAAAASQNRGTRRSRLRYGRRDGLLDKHIALSTARSVVLRSFDSPSALVEIGFMSNTAGELLLQSAQHRGRIGGPLEAGIEASPARAVAGQWLNTIGMVPHTGRIS